MSIIAKTKFLEFKSALSPSGHDWCYVKRTNDKTGRDSAVAITTLVKINGIYNFLILKTRRPPIYAENKAEFCLESPAGLIGDIDSNETLLKCAKKELLEETGFVADDIFIELLNSSASSGLTSETLSYVTAIVNKDTIAQIPVSDGGVITQRFYVPAFEIVEYLKNADSKKYSIAGAMVAGIFFALNRVN